MERNAELEGRTIADHQFVRPDENTKIPAYFSSVSSNPVHYFPEDSCDSILSLDEQDDEDDDDSAEVPGKSSQSGWPYQGTSPSGRVPKNQEPSAVEELQALMLSVGDASATASENPDANTNNNNAKKIESSMEVDYQRNKSPLLNNVPNLEMVEQPEESYRARYESEGCRGPIRGVSENGFPTVKVNGYSGNVVMTVFLVTESGEPHLHSITGPGSTKTTCKEVKLKDNITGIQTCIGPEQNMTAVWDYLSVRRIRNWDADKKLRERGEDPAAWKKKKKEARLMFQCTIPQTADRPGYILTCQSRPFMCTAPSGNPEIWWISEKESYAKGGKEIAIIGKKFSTGFRVRFYGTDSEGLWESLAEIDKAKSHQGGIVFKIPAYKNDNIEKQVRVNVEVRVGPEKDKRCSESIPFHYVPEENATEEEASKPCSYCDSVKSALSHLFKKEIDAEDIAAEVGFEPDRKRPSMADGTKSATAIETMQDIPSIDSGIILAEDKFVDRPPTPPSDLHSSSKQFSRPLVDDMNDEYCEKKFKTSPTLSSEPEPSAASQINVMPSIAASNLLAASKNAPVMTPSVLLSSQTVSPVFVCTSNVTAKQSVVPAVTTTLTAQVGARPPAGIALVPANVYGTLQQPIRLCVLNSQQAVNVNNFSNTFSLQNVQSNTVAQQTQQRQLIQQPVEQLMQGREASTILQTQSAQLGSYIQHVQPAQRLPVAQPFVQTPILQQNQPIYQHQPVHTASSVQQSQLAHQASSIQQGQFFQPAVATQQAQFIAHVSSHSQEVKTVNQAEPTGFINANQNATPPLTVKSAVEYVVLSNSGVVDNVGLGHVKQESSTIRPQCSVSFISDNYAPQIENTWSMSSTSQPATNHATVLSMGSNLQQVVPGATANESLANLQRVYFVPQTPLVQRPLSQSSYAASSTNVTSGLSSLFPQVNNLSVQNQLPSSSYLSSQVTGTQSIQLSQQANSSIALTQTHTAIAANTLLTTVPQKSNPISQLTQTLLSQASNPVSMTSASIAESNSFPKHVAAESLQIADNYQGAFGQELQRSANVATALAADASSNDSQCRKRSWPSQVHAVDSGTLPYTVDVVTQHQVYSSPVAQAPGKRIDGSFSVETTNLGDQLHGAARLFTSNITPNVPTGNDSSNEGLANAASNAVSYQQAAFTADCNVTAQPNLSNMQVESGAGWQNSNDVQVTETVDKTGRVLGSALAHDLNRLSVVGSNIQPQAFQSAPQDIPANGNQFSIQSNRGYSPSYSDPQPMSLTEDPIPEVMQNLPKDEPPEQRNPSAVDPNCGFMDGMRNYPAASTYHQTPAILLVTGQQQGQLAASFLAPDKDPAADIGSIQGDKMQAIAKAEDKSGGSAHLMNQYINEYGQLTNLNKQDGMQQYQNYNLNIEHVTSPSVTESNITTGASEVWQKQQTAAQNQSILPGSAETRVGNIPMDISDSFNAQKGQSHTLHYEQNADNTTAQQQQQYQPMPLHHINLQNEAFSQSDTTGLTNINFNQQQFQDNGRQSNEAEYNLEGMKNISSSAQQFVEQIPRAECSSQQQGGALKELLFQGQYVSVDTQNSQAFAYEQQQFQTSHVETHDTQGDRNSANVIIETNSIQQQQQHQLYTETTNQHTYPQGAQLGGCSISQQDGPSKGGPSIGAVSELTNQVGGMVHSKPSEAGEQKMQNISFTAEEAKRYEWNELLENTKVLLAEGLLTAKEAQSIYTCVHQEDNLLLEMYRTSKKGAEGTGKVLETLKHWVKNVKHVASE